MADNEIRIRSTLTAVHSVDETSGGNTYQKDVIDTNAGKVFGGKYDTLTAYTDDDICRWTNAVVSATSWDGLGDSGWTEATGVTDGTIPAEAYAVCVEFVSELGDAGTVDIRLNLDDATIVLAELDAGESVVIPIAGAIAPGKIEIQSTSYVNGTAEATVNVLILGI